MGIIRKLAVKSYKKEIIKLTEVLSKSDEENVAIFLIFSVWLRAILQIEGHINPLNRIDTTSINIDLDPGLYAYPIMLSEFEKHILFLYKEKENSQATALGLWVTTLRGIMRPRLNNEIKDLWELIIKSKKYWNEKLEIIYKKDIKLGIEKEFVESTLKLSKKILKCLPPRQIYQ